MTTRKDITPEQHAALIQAAATLAAAFVSTNHAVIPKPDGTRPKVTLTEEIVSETFGTMLHAAEEKFLAHLAADHHK